MSSRTLTLQDLRVVSSPLARFIEDGYIAGFDGSGGAFAVYNPRTTDLLGGPPPIYVCTMRERPTLVELEDASANWMDRKLAIAVARALAGGIIQVQTSGVILVVSETAADRALAAT